MNPILAQPQSPIYNLEALPDELKENIIKFLPLNAPNTIAATSKNWRQLFNGPIDQFIEKKIKCFEQYNDDYFRSRLSECVSKEDLFTILKNDLDRGREQEIIELLKYINPETDIGFDSLPKEDLLCLLKTGIQTKGLLYAELRDLVSKRLEKHLNDLVSSMEYFEHKKVRAAFANYPSICFDHLITEKQYLAAIKVQKIWCEINKKQEVSTLIPLGKAIPTGLPKFALHDFFFAFPQHLHSGWLYNGKNLLQNEFIEPQKSADFIHKVIFPLLRSFNNFEMEAALPVLKDFLTAESFCELIALCYYKGRFDMITPIYRDDTLLMKLISFLVHENRVLLEDLVRRLEEIFNPQDILEKAKTIEAWLDDKSIEWNVKFELILMLRTLFNKEEYEQIILFLRRLYFDKLTELISLNNCSVKILTAIKECDQLILDFLFDCLQKETKKRIVKEAALYPEKFDRESWFSLLSLEPSVIDKPTFEEHVQRIVEQDPEFVETLISWFEKNLVNAPSRTVALMFALWNKMDSLTKVQFCTGLRLSETNLNAIQVAIEKISASNFLLRNSRQESFKKAFYLLLHEFNQMFKKFSPETPWKALGPVTSNFLEEMGKRCDMELADPEYIESSYAVDLLKQCQSMQDHEPLLIILKQDRALESIVKFLGTLKMKSFPEFRTTYYFLINFMRDYFAMEPCALRLALAMLKSPFLQIPLIYEDFIKILRNAKYYSNDVEIAYKYYLNRGHLNFEYLLRGNMISNIEIMIQKQKAEKDIF